VGPWLSQFRERNLESRSSQPFVAHLRALRHAGAVSTLAALAVLGACAPNVSAGAWECPTERSADGGVSQPLTRTDPVPVPWSNGFEDGFCGYPGEDGPGYCYGDDKYLLVTEPHRPGGRVAAEFKVFGDGYKQTRCVRQGILPEAAIYGAWYFIPEALQDAPNWNLFHFQGADTPVPRPPDLWDVSLSEIGDSGNWELVVRDYLTPGGSTVYSGPDHKAVPIGRWFHIELLLKRASDSTGKVALYQDGALLFEQKNLKSDASAFTQWYVGDWAERATPANSSLYVDDVSISAPP